MPTLPALPTKTEGKLPEMYSAAKTALAKCARIDECKLWADKMEALASYARQQEDEDLLNYANRIKARAYRRAGEVFESIPVAKGRRPPNDGIGGDASPNFTRKEAAKEAGMSPDQAKTAIRVNRVPADEFEEAVESDDPPTVTALAQRGKATKPKEDILRGRDPADFKQATKLLGIVSHSLTECKDVDVLAACRGMDERETDRFLDQVERLIMWLTAARKEIANGFAGPMDHSPDRAMPSKGHHTNGQSYSDSMPTRTQSTL